MRLNHFVAFVVGLGGTALALAQPPAADTKFMKDAAADGKAEVQLGQLAADKASRDSVKDFDKMMVEDHTKAGMELSALASRNSVTLPAEPKPEHKALHDRLSRLSGAEFDRAYMAAMIKDHEKAVGLFRKEATSGGDADTKAWAAKTLPTLETHLGKAREVAARDSKSPHRH